MAQAYVNGYNPVAFTDFSGGLNLLDKADAVGDKEAIDLLNVTFTERGAIRQRDGYQDLTPQDLPNRVDSLAPFYTAAGLKQLVAGCGQRLDVVDTNGALVGSMTGLAKGPYTFARFGDPGHEYMYAANGADTLRRWDGAAWFIPTCKVDQNTGQAMPRAGSVTVTAMHAGSTSGNNAANRLVATAFGTQPNAGPGGQATTPSSVYLSMPGQPEVWETSGLAQSPIPIDGSPLVYGRNFFLVTPGDGERIMTAVTWRELVFIFKETKFFVIWGESTAADGTPTFQVREVVNNVGLASPLGVAVGRDGVYFINRRGIYKTTGSDPQLLSDKLSPLWTGDPDVYYQGQPINISRLEQARMAWFSEQLFVAIPTGTSSFNDRMLVHDGEHGWWTVYDIAASALSPFRRAGQSEVHHGYATGPQRIGHRGYGSTDDRGKPIVSRWRSGWADYSQPVQKTFRETKVWGSGSAGIAFSVDFNRGTGPTDSLIYGTAGDWPIGPAGNTYAGAVGKYLNYQVLKDSVSNYGELRS